MTYDQINAIVKALQGISKANLIEAETNKKRLEMEISQSVVMAPRPPGCGLD